MSRFFTGWCACGIVWCVDTDDFGWHLGAFALGLLLNAILWKGGK